MSKSSEKDKKNILRKQTHVQWHAKNRTKKLNQTYSLAHLDICKTKAPHPCSMRRGVISVHGYHAAPPPLF